MVAGNGRLALSLGAQVPESGAILYTIQQVGKLSGRSFLLESGGAICYFGLRSVLKSCSDFICSGATSSFGALGSLRVSV
jgi:hypothetical protein